MKTKYPRPTNTEYQPTSGARCGCRPGVQRDNCPTCEGTGWVIDFAAIRARTAKVCAGCGEPWPCSDSKRTDISGVERAKHHL